MINESAWNGLTTLTSDVMLAGKTLRVVKHLLENIWPDGLWYMTETVQITRSMAYGETRHQLTPLRINGKRCSPIAFQARSHAQP